MVLRLNFVANYLNFFIFFRGGCQAIEDAYVLTENLANTKSTEKIADSLQDFYRKRIIRVSAVQFLSRLASDLIVNAFDTPWSPHDNLGKSWKSYLTFFWKVSERSAFTIHTGILVYGFKLSEHSHILQIVTIKCLPFRSLFCNISFSPPNLRFCIPIIHREGTFLTHSDFLKLVCIHDVH